MSEDREIECVKAVVLAAQRFREHDTLRAKDELFDALDALDAAQESRLARAQRPF